MLTTAKVPSDRCDRHIYSCLGFWRVWTTVQLRGLWSQQNALLLKQLSLSRNIKGNQWDSGIAFTIHQIFFLTCNWSKHIMWPNIWEYSPIFKTEHVVRNIWRIVNTVASIWHKKMLKYLSLDINCSSKLGAVFLKLCFQKTVCSSEQIMSVDKYLSIYLPLMKVFILYILVGREIEWNNNKNSLTNVPVTKTSDYWEMQTSILWWVMIHVAFFVNHKYIGIWIYSSGLSFSKIGSQYS